MQPRILFCALVFAAAASGAEVSGPVAGFVWDAGSLSVRPVLGIPGASLIGNPLDFGLPLTYAAIAPNQDFILATASDGTVRLLRPGVKTAAILETVHGAPSRIVFSPSGSAAMLLNSDTADIYTGLPGAPVLARTVSLSSIGETLALAVSDDGTAALAASADAVWAAGESAEWTLLTRVPGARVAFAPNSRHAAVAARSGVSLHRDPTGAGEAASLSAAGETAPDAVAFARDGRILVAYSAARSVSLFDPSGAHAAVACDCAPTHLSALGSFFRLTEVSDAPVWLLDTGKAEPRVVFVPAPPAPQLRLPETP